MLWTRRISLLLITQPIQPILLSSLILLRTFLQIPEILLQWNLPEMEEAGAEEVVGRRVHLVRRALRFQDHRSHWK